MNSKADLKAAREAIGKKEYNEAVKACKRVLLWEGQNYNAWVFLGVAYTNLENDEEAEEAYKRAIEINNDNMLGWQGLVNFYEKRNKFQQLADIINQLIPRVIESGDGKKLAEYFKKLLIVYKEQNEPAKYLETLKQFLPISPHHDLIKDQPDLPDQKDIWNEIITKMEKEQKQQIENEVAARRFRVNAGTPAQVLSQVEGEVYSVSKLNIMYENVLKLISEPEQRKVWELKLLHFNSKKLLGVKDKSQLYEEILTQARALLDVNDPLPLQILIESANVDSADKYDWTMMDDLMSRFPEFGLSKLAQGYKLYKEGDIDQAFDYFSDGLDGCPDSIFGYLCVSRIYYEAKEYETGLEYATRGKDLVKKVKIEQGVSKTNALCSFEICMAHCYRLLDKKYHMDAMALYKSILERHPDNTDALEGAGLILIEEKRLEDAFKNFERVHELDPNNHKALAELGWIYSEKKEYDLAIQNISKALDIAGTDVSEYYYRLGRIYWSLEDFNSALKYFMQAVKADPYFASGFTYLGHYYREIKKDDDRAKKCYQKARVLDPLDTDAAYWLSNYLIAENENEEAEGIFRQVTETNPKTGWAWRRIGYVYMNANSYNEAITCFQKALRADTGDVRCWSGLAEAYSRAGRFVAALKAFDRATQLDPHSIHAANEKAYVQQKVGLLDDAIVGFKHTLELAQEQGKANYIPALAGLAETYLEHAREDFQAGFFGRASDGCNMVFKTVLLGLEQDASMIAFWKLVGDACAFYRHIPKYLDNCDYASLCKVLQYAQQAHDQLKLEADITRHWILELLSLEDINDDFSLPATTAMDVILSCASYAYKQAIVSCKNHIAIAPAFWHDLAIIYYHLGLNGNHQEGMTAVKCAKVALKFEPTQYMYWNSLGVIAMTVGDMPKLAQYAFVKAMEFNTHSAIPWTNYGFLCLSMKDYELANSAFETAHALDPEWISAWVGQAYVASLWGTDAAGIFEHAFESSNGSAMNASYDYANTVYQGLSNGQLRNNSAAITPVFALEKLTEKKLNDALALNLLGLLLERLGQFGRAAEAFASAILAIETQVEENKLTPEEGASRLAKVHANLGRTLCASGDFEGAIQTVSDASGVYAQLNAGIAYYFLDKLPESLSMFEMALNATQEDISLRQDVIVLLSKVLWALGGDEQRSVAKDQLFSSITENPNYLPAIFSLCVMGMLEDDETLTAAALQELAKVSVHIAYESDTEQLISWIFSKFYELKGESSRATKALMRSIHQTPWLSLVWSRLSKQVVKLNDSSKKMVCDSSLAITSQSDSANLKSEAYEYAAKAEENISNSRKYAQRAILIAPWRINAWKTL